MLVQLAKFEKVEIYAAILCTPNEVVSVERLMLCKYPR
jgi:hypothetical protein